MASIGAPPSLVLLQSDAPGDVLQAFDDQRADGLQALVSRWERLHGSGQRPLENATEQARLAKVRGRGPRARMMSAVGHARDRCNLLVWAEGFRCGAWWGPGNGKTGCSALRWRRQRAEQSRRAAVHR